jgi:hypothetical protein
MVIYINEAGELCWQSTSVHLAQRVGMLELAKHWMLARSTKS